MILCMVTPFIQMRKAEEKRCAEVDVSLEVQGEICTGHMVSGMEMKI